MNSDCQPEFAVRLRLRLFYFRIFCEKPQKNADGKTVTPEQVVWSSLNETVPQIIFYNYAIYPFKNA